VFQLLRDINAAGTSVVMASHDAALVREANYRTLELKQGRLVADSGRDAVEALA
jgi:cell division transport system ATP-binding protein